MRFEGKKAIVVGGGGGMGLAMCLGFAKEGADVAVLDFVGEAAESVAKKVRGMGQKSLGLKVDVSDFKAVNDCITKVHDNFSRIDILVNAAGYGQFIPFAEMSEEMWDRSIAVHLKGTFNATRAVINFMISQKYGRIISISSLAGVRGTPTHVHYSAAKAGIIGMSKALAQEVVNLGITVNVIVPGTTDTPFLKSVKAQSADLFERSKRIPIGRLCKPEEVAALCLYLASDDAAYITGDVIGLYGGLYT